MGKIVDVGDVPCNIGVVEVYSELYFLILGRKKFYFVDKALSEKLVHLENPLEPILYKDVESIEYDKKR